MASYPEDLIHKTVWAFIINKIRRKMEKRHMAKKHHFVVDMVIPQYLRMFDDCERVTIRKKSYILCKNAKVSELCQHFGLDEPEMIHLSQGTFGIPSEIRIKPNFSVCACDLRL